MGKYVKFLIVAWFLIIAQEALATDSSFNDNLTGDWNGVRQELKNKGLEIGIEWTPEIFDNFRGGIHQGITGASTIDLNLTLDTEKIFSWKEGKLYIDLEDHSGHNPTTELVGDLQVFDQLSFSPYFEIFEFWYQQQLLNKKIRIKIGKLDANAEFSVIENGLSFLNSSTQVSPTILAFPTSPDPVLGANLFFTPNKSWFLSLGAFDANQQDKFGIFYGNPQTALIAQNGALLISETGFKYKTGNFKFGVWKHTGTFMRLNGGTQQGASGYYTIFNQILWEPTGEFEKNTEDIEDKKGKGIRGFVSYGQTQESVGIMNWNYSTGVTWTGLFAKHSKDILGFSANYAHISTLANCKYPYELALEFIYKLHIHKAISLVPDLQYIIHPGGQFPNALVGTLHIKINL